MSFKISQQTYIKLLMHSLKYPYAKVNGILLSKEKKLTKSSDNDNKSTITENDEIEFIDYLPLFHFNLGLTPMLEIALIQIQIYCKKHHLRIAGYFQANKNFHDSSVDVFAQKICEKLSESNPSTAILILNSCNLADFLSKEIPFNTTLDIFRLLDGKWKLDDLKIKINKDDTEIKNTIRHFIFEEQLHFKINDFDCHLHDIKCDWLNKDLNDLIN